MAFPIQSPQSFHNHPLRAWSVPSWQKSTIWYQIWPGLLSVAVRKPDQTNSSAEGVYLTLQVKTYSPALKKSGRGWSRGREGRPLSSSPFPNLFSCFPCRSQALLLSSGTTHNGPGSPISIIKSKKMPTDIPVGQSDGGNYSTGSPLPRSLILYQLTKTNQPRCLRIKKHKLRDKKLIIKLLPNC